MAHPSVGVKGPSRSSVGFQFIAIPSQLLKAADLSFGAVLLFGVIADAVRQNRSGLCKLANATLGERIGRSESEVGRYMLELEAAGMVARDFVGQSKFVRTGVRVTWTEGVPDVSVTTPVQVPELQEGGSRNSGARVPDVPGPIQSPPQREISDGGISPSLGKDEDAAARATNGPEAAAYLRACIEAGRRGQPMPEPPAPQGVGDPCGLPTKGAYIENTPSPASQPSPDEARRTVGGFVRSLADRLKAETVGPRRVGPAKLARQLSEMRRRNAGR